MSYQVQDHPSVKVVIPGVSGVGKSTLFEKLIRREKARVVFLYDHKHGDLARRFNTRPCYTAAEIVAATQRGGFVIYDPGKEFPGKPEEGFSHFCNLVWTFGTAIKGRKIFGCDELDCLTDTNVPPENLLLILDQGRTFQFDCFFITQAMNTLHNGVRKQMVEVFAFRQGDERGLGWLTEKGFDGDALMKLENGLWHYRNLTTGASATGGTAFKPKNSGRNLKGL